MHLSGSLRMTSHDQMEFSVCRPVHLFVGPPHCPKKEVKYSIHNDAHTSVSLTINKIHELALVVTFSRDICRAPAGEKLLVHPQIASGHSYIILSSSIAMLYTPFIKLMTMVYTLMT